MGGSRVVSILMSKDQFYYVPEYERRSALADINTAYTPGPLENDLIRDINANTGQSYDDINRIVADIFAISKAYPNSFEAERVIVDASTRADITKLGFPPGSVLTGVTYGPILRGQAPGGRPLELHNNNIGTFDASAHY